MDKRFDLKNLVSDAEKAAKGLLNSAIQTVDQNDDGKFDFSDVTTIAENMGNAVKKGTKELKENAEQKAKMLELKTLQPIFRESLDNADFLLSKLIRVVERDKKHAESEVCQGSIGFVSNQKELRFVNIFKDSLGVFGLTLYPDSDCDFYYVDPSDRDRYIALDEYFNHLKIVRINELKKIAQDLGAKYFKVTYKEEQASSLEKKARCHTKAIVTADGEHNRSEKNFSKIEIAAEMRFPGHAPIEPQLKYMQRDQSIRTLVKMRMDEKSPLLHEKYMLKLSNSSGIRESDAVKIDAALKVFKYSGNANVAMEAHNESRRYLEYEIEF